MTLTAHTNAVGNHSRYETKVARRWGTSDYDNDGVYVDHNVVHSSKTIETARSWKPAHVKGDHKSVYPYTRKARMVIQDLPMTWRSRLFGGSHLINDETYEQYISVLHTPFNYNPSSGGWMGNIMKEADVKALNKLAEDKAQLAADLAQVRQTVDMFADEVTRAARVLLALKRGVANQIPYLLGISPAALRRDRGRSIANYWLEYSYGWKPLAQSVHDVQKVLHKSMSKNREIQGKGTAKYNLNGEFLYRNEIWKEKQQGRAKTQITARLDNPSAAQMNSYGLINPASVAWELVPWSFAIDWFMPVGQTLEAATAAVGLDFVKGLQSRHYDYELISVGDLSRYAYNGFSGMVEPGQYIERGWEFERQVYNNFPVPQFYADTTPFSTARALNALALVRQLHK